MSDEESNERSSALGVWIIGARGSIATTLTYGLSGLRQGLLEPIGIATETVPFRDLPLRAIDDMVLGGHEISNTSLSATAAELVRSGVLPADLVAASSAEAAAFDACIKPGILDVADVGDATLDPAVAALGGATQRDKVERLTADIVEFKNTHELDRVVVVNLASTERWSDELECCAELELFESALDDGTEIPASSLYAYAALCAGAPFVNFTPNRGAAVPALRELARQRGLPHCGNDGKTGETLLKTALAPMFAARRLRVLAWQGYNMLGNRDGASLADPMRKRSKMESKDAPLRAILADDAVHTSVGIDYVPSLHDWKTAMDFVHVQGFLGAKMSLQFTWTGSDSALAAPLVIDLIRFADYAAAIGEVGEMKHTACFFKSPIGGGTHDFHAQFQKLLSYAAERSSGSSGSDAK